MRVSQEVEDLYPTATYHIKVCWRGKAPPPGPVLR